jgi:putative flippase GtrA
VAVVEANSGLMRQVTRFVGFGVLSAAVDFGVYQGLLSLGAYTDVAKGTSFILGTITAYLLNRRWTFDSAGGTAPAIRFAALYTTTFFVNVAMNSLMLHALTGHRFAVPIAWVIAQGITTAINFILLRLFVFRDRRAPELEVLDTLEHALSDQLTAHLPHHRVDAPAFDGLTED